MLLALLTASVGLPRSQCNVTLVPTSHAWGGGPPANAQHLIYTFMIGFNVPMDSLLTFTWQAGSKLVTSQVAGSVPAAIEPTVFSYSRDLIHANPTVSAAATLCEAIHTRAHEAEQNLQQERDQHRAEWGAFDPDGSKQAAIERIRASAGRPCATVLTASGRDSVVLRLGGAFGGRRRAESGFSLMGPGAGRPSVQAPDVGIEQTLAESNAAIDAANAARNSAFAASGRRIELQCSRYLAQPSSELVPLVSISCESPDEFYARTHAPPLPPSTSPEPPPSSLPPPPGPSPPPLPPPSASPSPPPPPPSPPPHSPPPPTRPPPSTPAATLVPHTTSSHLVLVGVGVLVGFGALGLHLARKRADADYDGGGGGGNSLGGLSAELRQRLASFDAQLSLSERFAPPLLRLIERFEGKLGVQLGVGGERPSARRNMSSRPGRSDADDIFEDADESDVDDISFVGSFADGGDAERAPSPRLEPLETLTLGGKCAKGGAKAKASKPKKAPATKRVTGDSLGRAQRLMSIDDDDEPRAPKKKKPAVTLGDFD